MLKSSHKKLFIRAINSFNGQKKITVFLFMLIPLFLLITFTYIPAVNLIRYSVERRDRFGYSIQFTGLENFISIFTRSEYMIAFKNTTFYLLGYLIQFVLSLLLALILCSKIKGLGFIKDLIFFPYMLNIVAVALIFKHFFNSGDGVFNAEGTLNSLLLLFGYEPFKWLSTEFIVNICLVFASIWKNIGLSTIIFMSAIQSIPKAIYDAAILEGANRRKILKYIILPNIRPIIALQILLAVRGAFGVFEIPYIMTAGKFGSSTLVIKTVETAFIFDKVGLASAMAVLLLIIIVIMTLIQKTITKEETQQ